MSFLDAMKEWVEARKALFSLPPPNGEDANSERAEAGDREAFARKALAEAWEKAEWTEGLVHERNVLGFMVIQGGVAYRVKPDDTVLVVKLEDGE